MRQFHKRLMPTMAWISEPLGLGVPCLTIGLATVKIAGAGISWGAVLSPFWGSALLIAATVVLLSVVDALFP